MPLDMWFDELVEEHPLAEKYRPDVRRLVDMFWEEAEDRVKLENEVADLKKRLDFSNARADGIQARRKYAFDLSMQMFDRGSSYTNLIMSAGYAALLTAWTTSYSSIEPAVARLIGALALASLFGFVVWEVVKMIYVAYINRTLAKSLAAPDHELAGKLENWSERNSRMHNPLKLAWLASLLVTVPTGLAAGVLLIWQLVLPKL